METSFRKLDNNDVRAIFESLHDHKPPPQDVKFKILPVGPNGMKLSPPPHEYEDGIYVLLRPDKSQKQKKKKNKKRDSHEPCESPKIPPHLAHLKMEIPLSNSCPWSLSGPQFPQPTAIQQRYCYPKVYSKYASTKGGTLWTMFNSDGEEDEEFRLLHIYYSTKRANTLLKKMKDAPQPAQESGDFEASSKNKVRQSGHFEVSIKKKVQQSGDFEVSTKNKRTPKRKRLHVPSKNKTKKKCRPARKPNPSSLPSGSPPPSSTCKKEDPIFRQSSTHISSSAVSNSSGYIQTSIPTQASFEGHKIFTMPSILYNNDFHLFESNETSPCYSSESFPNEEDRYQEPPFRPTDLAHDIDDWPGDSFADPYPMMDHNTELLALTKADDATQSKDESQDALKLMRSLGDVHEKIVEWIRSRPRSEKGNLLSIVANWARSISQSPFDILVPNGGNKYQRDYLKKPDRGSTPLKMEDLDASPV